MQLNVAIVIFSQPEFTLTYFMTFPFTQDQSGLKSIKSGILGRQISKKLILAFEVPIIMQPLIPSTLFIILFFHF